MMGLMGQSLFNLKNFSRSINNITAMRRHNLITQASQRACAIGKSQEKLSWTADHDTGYYRPETITKELAPYMMTTCTSDVKMRRGEELWWMPDPETGFYRPTIVRELDPVELRSIHFNEDIKTL